MILEAAVALLVGAAGPQSVGADIADLQRRLRALREQADSAQPASSIVLHTDDEFRSAAKRSLVGKLRQPTSAQFRNVYRRRTSTGQIFCGEINSRNGLGGMTGFVRFQAFAARDGRTYAEIDSEDGALGAYFDMGWNRDCTR